MTYVAYFEDVITRADERMSLYESTTIENADIFEGSVRTAEIYPLDYYEHSGRLRAAQAILSQVNAGYLDRRSVTIFRNREIYELDLDTNLLYYTGTTVFDRSIYLRKIKEHSAALKLINSFEMEFYSSDY